VHKNDTKVIYLGGKMFVQVIVGYDISDTKNRTKMFNDLKDVGLLPIQKSLFWGYILPSEKRLIKNLFKKYCDIKIDKAIISNVNIDKSLDDTFGYDKDDFKHPQGFEII